ncbi:MAG: hypothetical protein P8Y11_03735 [Gemmatimonadales bacterium]
MRNRRRDETRFWAYGVGRVEAIIPAGVVGSRADEQTDFKPINVGRTAPALVIQGLDDKIAPAQDASTLSGAAQTCG